MTEGFWWAALVIAGFSAAAHLFSMLGTRWGDRRISFKALLFSLMLHLALLFGLFAVGPRLDRLTRYTSDPPPVESDTTPITIRDIETAEPEPQLADATGDSPLWDRPNATPAEAPERTARPAELPEVVEQERSTTPPDDSPPPPVTLPDLLPELDPATPEAATAAVPALDVAAETPELEEETAAAQVEERPSLARVDRSPMTSPGESLPAERAAPEAAERVDETFDPRMQLADLRNSDSPADLPSTMAPDSPLDLERPTAPVPLPTEPEPGAGEPSEGTTGDAEVSPRFSRRPGRAPAVAGDTPEAERADPGRPSSPARSDIAMSRIDSPRPSTGDLPALSRPDATPLSTSGTGIPETYQLRSLDRRSDVARQHGGTAGSEAAVERSLKWLAASQHADGYWDADEYGAGQVEVDEQGVRRNNAGKTADSGLTALAILAFLGAGYTHDEGDYADTVDRALIWLVDHQRDDGFLGYGAAHFEQMYCHGMATYALAEAYGMRGEVSDQSLRRPLEKAILYIAAMQGEDGGWRYQKGQDGDMSMFGWQLMALKSAEIAGVPMPGKTRSKMILFLRDRSLGKDGGLAAYRKTDPQIPATPAMTAEALFSKQILGMTRTNPASLEAVAYLLKNTPKRSELNYYYWYYGTLAMFQYGGTSWDRWNASLRDLLIAEQIKEGPDAGSWPPRDAWGLYGGRVYSTAVATLSLEVYYRFLPLYRAVELPAASPPIAEPRPER